MSGQYDDAQARPEFYAGGFDPRNFLRLNTDDEGRKEWTLDVKHKRQWFRVVFPNGRIDTTILEKDERHAYMNARVYADKSDPPEHFLAEGKAERFAPSDLASAKPYELYFADWAETVAIGRALTNAGFDIPFFNITADGQLVNPLTGEIVDGQPPQPQQTAQQAPTKQYSDLTAPPAAAATLLQSQPAARKVGDTQPPPAQQPGTAAVNTPAPVQQTLQASPAQVAVPVQPPAIIEPRDEAEALQMPLEWAMNYRVTVGMFRGQKLRDVALQDSKKLEWYLNGYKGPDFKLRAAARILLDNAMAQAG